MATLPELETRALFTIGQPVHWRGSVYRVTGRYWRRWNNTIVYDLIEVVQPGRSPRHQSKVREEEMAKPSRYVGVGVIGSGARDFRACVHMPVLFAQACLHGEDP